MNILHLTLKKGWFDMIASGEKKEEYREIKPYWVKRLLYGYEKECHTVVPERDELIVYLGKLYSAEMTVLDALYKNYDIIRFRNGYGRFAPVMDVECKGLHIGVGHYVFGAPNYEVFILTLGEILSISRHDEILNDNYIPTPYKPHEQQKDTN